VLDYAVARLTLQKDAIFGHFAWPAIRFGT